MHERGVSSDNRRNLDRELKRLRCQVIVTEVEIADGDISIKCIDHVTTALEADPAMRHVQVAQRIACCDKLGEHSA